MTNPLNAYKEVKVKTASQGRLIIMLYEEAVRQIDKAVAGIEQEPKDFELINGAIIKAQDLITELMVSLDFDKGGDIARNLFSLYMYFNRELMEANFRKEPGALPEIRTMLDDLRGAWEEILEKNGNAQGGSGGINVAG